eukprot:TRINITY_DN13488_c0_g1_i1.p1 TRINITY_DN13488_c0_g1~~TRINITY_DN13488_c0_g1_i1.p1  ORF type:complete len:2758 (+),score=725.15 TRINITY_DN13488_c0_g1_i1:347-8275(+)
MSAAIGTPENLFAVGHYVMIPKEAGAGNDASAFSFQLPLRGFQSPTPSLRGGGGKAISSGPVVTAGSSQGRRSSRVQAEPAEEVDLALDVSLTDDDDGSDAEYYLARVQRVAESAQRRTHAQNVHDGAFELPPLPDRAPPPATKLYDVVYKAGDGKGHNHTVSVLRNIPAKGFRVGRWHPGCEVVYCSRRAVVIHVGTDEQSAVDIGAGGALTLSFTDGGALARNVHPWEVDDIPFHEGAMRVCELLMCDLRVPRVSSIVRTHRRNVGQARAWQNVKLTKVRKLVQQMADDALADDPDGIVAEESLASVEILRDFIRAQSSGSTGLEEQVQRLDSQHLCSEHSLEPACGDPAAADGDIDDLSFYAPASVTERYMRKNAYELVTDEAVALYLLKNSLGATSYVEPVYAASRGWLRVLLYVKHLVETRKSQDFGEEDALSDQPPAANQALWDEPDEDGVTPVAHAILTRRLDVLEFLLEAGATADSCIASGHHHLFLAVDASEDAGSPLRNSTESVETFTSTTLEAEHVRVAFLNSLVEHDKDVFVKNPQVLGYAAKHGKVNAVSFLLSRLHRQDTARPVHATSVKWFDKVPYEWTLHPPSQSREAILLRLIDEGVRPSVPALIQADAGAQYTAALTKLLRIAPELVNGTDPVTGNTALINACRYGNLPAFLLLIDAGANTEIVNASSKKALFYAAGLRNAAPGTGSEMMRHLLARGASVRRTEALGYAAKLGHATRVCALLRAPDCNPNEQYLAKYPIDHASDADHKSRAMVQALCGHEDLDVWLADIASLGSRHFAAVEMLARRASMRSSISEADETYGRSPLAWVAMSGYSLTMETGDRVLYREGGSHVWTEGTLAGPLRPMQSHCSLTARRWSSASGMEVGGARVKVRMADVAPVSSYDREDATAYRGMTVLVRGNAAPGSGEDPGAAHTYHPAVVESVDEDARTYCLLIEPEPADASEVLNATSFGDSGSPVSPTGKRYGRLLMRPGAERWGDVPAEKVFAYGRRTGILMRLLLDLGADLNAVDNAGKSVLFHAVQSGDVETAEWLLAQSVRVAGTGAVLAATRRGYVPLLEKILDAGGSLFRTWNGQFPAETCRENRAMTEFLLARIADDNAPKKPVAGLGAIGHSAGNLSPAASPRGSVHSRPVSAASTVTSLLQMLPPPCLPSLWWCAQNGWVDCARNVAAQYPHVVDVKGPSGVTAASQAAMLGRVEILTILAEAGANIGPRTLFLASQYGHLSCVTYLVSTLKVPLCGSSAMPVAGISGHVHIVKKLAAIAPADDLEGAVQEVFLGKSVITGVNDEGAMNTVIDSLQAYLTEPHFLYFASRGMPSAVEKLLDAQAHQRNLTVDGVWNAINTLTQGLRAWPVRFSSAERMAAEQPPLSAGTVCVVNDPISQTEWVAKIIQVISGHPDGRLRYRCHDPIGDVTVVVFDCEIETFDDFKALQRGNARRWKCLKLIMAWCVNNGVPLREAFASRGRDDNLNRLCAALRKNCWRGLEFYFEALREEAWDDVFCDPAFLFLHRVILRQLALPASRRCNDQLRMIDEGTRLAVFCRLAKVMHAHGALGKSGLDLACKHVWEAAVVELAGKHGIPPTRSAVQYLAKRVQKVSMKDGPGTKATLQSAARIAERLIETGVKVPMNHVAMICALKGLCEQCDKGALPVTAGEYFQSYLEDWRMGLQLSVDKLRWQVQVTMNHMVTDAAEQTEVRPFSDRIELGLLHLAALWNDEALIDKVLALTGDYAADDCDNDVTRLVPRDFTRSRACHETLLRCEEGMGRIPELTDIDLILEIDRDHVPFDLVNLLRRLCSAEQARPTASPPEIKWQINRLDCGAFVWEHPKKAHVTYVICNASEQRLEAEAQATHIAFVSQDDTLPGVIPTFNSAARQLLVENILETLSGDLEYYRCQCGAFNPRASAQCVVCAVPVTEAVITDRWLSALLDSGSVTRVFGVHDASAQAEIEARWTAEPFRSYLDYIVEKNSREFSDEDAAGAGDRAAERASWYTQAQMLNNYFGTQIMFYFMFAGFFLAWLVPLVVAGVMFTAWQGYRGALDTELTVISSIVSILWVSLLAKMWRRKSSELAFMFGVRNHEDLCIPSAAYLVNNQHRTKIRHPITGTIEPQFTSLQRLPRYLLTYLVTLFMLAIVTVAMLLNHRLRLDLDPDGDDLTMQIVSGVQSAVSVIFLNTIYELIAGTLSDWENHRTTETREQSLILKTFFFELVNGLSGPTLTVVTGGTEQELLTQVLALMVVQAFSSLIKEKVIVALYIKVMTDDVLDLSTDDLRNAPSVADSASPGSDSYIGSGGYAAGSDGNSFTDSLGGSTLRCGVTDGDKEEKNQRIRAFLKDSQKPSLLRNVRDDYSHVMLQIAYICSFSGVVPLAPLVALLTGVVELHTDLYKYLHLLQRPAAKRASGIGVWAFCLDMVTLLSLPYNVFITFVMLTGWRRDPADFALDLALETDAEGNVTGVDAVAAGEQCHQVGGALLFFVLLVLLKVGITRAFSDTATWVRMEELADRFASVHGKGARGAAGEEGEGAEATKDTNIQQQKIEASERALDALGDAVTRLLGEDVVPAAVRKAFTTSPVRSKSRQSMDDDSQSDSGSEGGQSEAGGGSRPGSLAEDDREDTEAGAEVDYTALHTYQD